MKLIEVNKLVNPLTMYVRAMQSSTKRPGVIESLPPRAYGKPPGRRPGD